MSKIREKIEKRIVDAGSGYVFTRKDFQDIASSGSIGQILSRMVKDGIIRRIGRGVFDLPNTNAVLGGQLSPDLDQAANALARKFRWSILPYGNLAANRLGLSQQVPAKLTYLSDGPTKELKIENRVIYFKHARPKEIYANSYISGLVVQALRYFGKDRVGDEMIAYLKQKLSHNEKTELLENIHYSTEWIHEVIQKNHKGLNVDKVAKLDRSDRLDLFNETAARMGLNPVIIEKDFWVCWMLKQLFTIKELNGMLIFKGGTSLSKCFNLIQRFSEDIDIAVDFEKLGFLGEKDPRQVELSYTKRDVLLKEMLAACQDFIARELFPVLTARIKDVLGADDWQLLINTNDSNIVEFEYPTSIEAKLDYIRPRVILELGTHAEPVPNAK